MCCLARLPVFRSMFPRWWILLVDLSRRFDERLSRHAYTDATYPRKRERDTMMMRFFLILPTTVISQLSLLSHRSTFPPPLRSLVALPPILQSRPSPFRRYRWWRWGVELRLDGYMYLGLPRPNLITSRRHRRNSSLSRVRYCSSATNREKEDVA